MECPNCGLQGARVVESREGAQRVLRRRECARCDATFTTDERLRQSRFRVIKRPPNPTPSALMKLLAAPLGCPKCGEPGGRIIEARKVNYQEVRRRRECGRCGARFTTSERPRPGFQFIRRVEAPPNPGRKIRLTPERLLASLLLLGDEAPR